ncbi:hypothetical protein [Streptomyces sp. NPDC126514]|uniref:hypothetical protein n=1 Tax=Streptomyces sp. NPDC126514 TaxID=3155210 RepID=UPI003332616C
MDVLHVKQCKAFVVSRMRVIDGAARLLRQDPGNLHRPPVSRARQPVDARCRPQQHRTSDVPVGDQADGEAEKGFVRMHCAREISVSCADKPVIAR